MYSLPKPYVLDPTPWTLRPECLDAEIYIDAFSAYLHLTVIPIALSQRTLNVANTVPKNGRLARAAGGNDPVVTSARVMSSYRFSTIMQQSKDKSADLSFARDPRAMPPPVSFCGVGTDSQRMRVRNAALRVGAHAEEPPSDLVASKSEGKERRNRDTGRSTTPPMQSLRES